MQQMQDFFKMGITFNSLSTIVVCWWLLQTVWTQIRPDNMSGLIRIQTVWHSDGIPEIIFRKSWFWKKSADGKKCMNNFPGGKELNMQFDWNTVYSLYCVPVADPKGGLLELHFEIKLFSFLWGFIRKNEVKSANRTPLYTPEPYF